MTDSPETTIPSAYQTDTMVFAIKDGEPVACGWKQDGPDGIKWTNRMVSKWIKEGFDVRMMHKDEPETKALFDAVWRQLGGKEGTRV